MGSDEEYQTMKSKRNLNGYTVIYKPEHPTAMRNKVWAGYVYEHVYVMETILGRSLTCEEVVHHLDGDRSNNYHANLLVVLRSEHAKLHAWLDSGAPGLETASENGENCWKPYCWTNSYRPRHCAVCDCTLQSSKLATTCSKLCATKLRSTKSKKPSKSELLRSYNNCGSMLSLGRKYKVSDNAVRKWFKSYGIDPKAISRRALDTSKEASETSGEVQSS